MIRRPPRSTLVERRRQRQMCIRDSSVITTVNTTIKSIQCRLHAQLPLPPYQQSLEWFVRLLANVQSIQGRYNTRQQLTT